MMIQGAVISHGPSAKQVAMCNCYEYRPSLGSNSALHSAIITRGGAINATSILFRLREPICYYSISSDYSPTQTFDEDGDSFTSFGSIQTPPRLRAMIRSIFDGTLNSPIRSFPDSDYGDAGSPHERVPDHIPAAIVAEGLNEASIPPLPFDGEPMAYSSDQDGEYELDDSTAASTPDTGPDHHPVVDESAIDLNGFHYALDTTNGIARDIGSPNLNEIAVSHIDPSLQLPSGADDQGDIDSVFSLIDPYEDPSDTTYVPPKERRQSRSGRKRSSGSFLAKPKPAFIRPRDSRGRFVSLQPRNLGKLRAASVDDQPPQSSSSSTTLPRAAVDSGHPHLTETALNTFLNTVLTSPDEAFPLSFHLPDPGDNPPKTIHDPYQHQWVLPPMLPPLLPTAY
ncbi:hypothetical protein PGT21_020687 [Puccinia graminis f. sp. tritici]|uniref:Uncharacterized protein n=1 Tax=Puccinia graminis f. sp. tritici TaxID=56615 RepID=A0A5B0P2Z2_PUCGR|nr:hypothetical protein PGT21_020687 [Puccinia graminis f. sp. tritici]